MENYDEMSLEELTAAAEGGDSVAQQQLGVRYAFGQNAEKDAEKAFEWIKKSADQGNLLGQYALAHMYLDGRGTVQDVPKAIKLLEIVARNYDVASSDWRTRQAKFELAELYENGRYLLPNLELAAVLYECIYENVNPNEIPNETVYKNTIEKLAALYPRLDTSGMSQNELAKHVKKTKEFNRIAAENGDASSMARYGIMCFEGSAPDAGLSWLRKAAAEGDFLAKMYMQQNNIKEQGKSGGCYVATAVYGSYDCPEVWTLRRYRDNTLAQTWYGRAFIKTYYAISPKMVKWFGETKWFNKLFKGKLDRFVSKLQFEGVESTPYEDMQF